MKASTVELDEAVSVPYADRTPSGLHVPVVVGPEQVAERIVSLPMYPELTAEQLQRVIRAVKKFADGGKRAL